MPRKTREGYSYSGMAETREPLELTKPRFRMLLVAILTGLLIGSVSGISAQAASYPSYGSCPSSDGVSNPGGLRYYSIACEGGSVMNAISSYENVPNEWNSATYNGSPLLINQGLWLASGAPCGYDWTEWDIINYDGMYGEPSGIVLQWNAYAWNGSRSVLVDQSNVGVVSIGSTFGLELMYLGNGAWGAAYGINMGSYYAWHIISTQAPGGDGGCRASVGLEDTPNPADTSHPIDSSSYSSTFTATSLAWEDTGNAWHSGWQTAYYGVAWPCGDAWNGTTLSAPNCFNGTYYGSTEWADNHLA